MAIGATGSKSKSKQSGTVDQTQTSALSDRGASVLNQGMADIQGQQYHAYDPASAQQFMNPYQSQVIDASMAQADHADAMARNQQNSDFGKAGAFGDSRRGVYQAELAGQQSRDRGQLLAGLNSANFGQAQTAAMGQNDNQNAYSLQIQQLLNQLRGGFTQEGTQTLNGKTTGKTSGYNLGMTGSWSPASGFNA